MDAQSFQAFAFKFVQKSLMLSQTKTGGIGFPVTSGKQLDQSHNRQIMLATICLTKFKKKLRIVLKTLTQIVLALPSSWSLKMWDRQRRELQVYLLILFNNLEIKFKVKWTRLPINSLKPLPRLQLQQKHNCLLKSFSKKTFELKWHKASLTVVYSRLYLSKMLKQAKVQLEAAFRRQQG